MNCKPTTINRVISNPTIPFHPTIPNVSLDFDQALGVQVRDRVPIFIPVAGLFGPCADPGRLLRSPMMCGAIISCQEEVWTVESEPTRGNAFGLLVHNANGKCIMAGEGTVSNIDLAGGRSESSTDSSREAEGSRRSAPVMKFQVRTVYDGVSTGSTGEAKKTGTLSGTVGPEGPSVTASTTKEF
jgi:hypothetical protein